MIFGNYRGPHDVDLQKKLILLNALYRSSFLKTPQFLFFNHNTKTKDFRLIGTHSTLSGDLLLLNATSEIGLRVIVIDSDGKNYLI